MTRSATRNMCRQRRGADISGAPDALYAATRIVALSALFFTTLPVAVCAAQPAPQTQQSCVDVKVGSAQSYDCLNQKLSAVAHNAQRPSSQDAPYSATSPGNVTGQFNESATRDRLGTNFGKSVTPERPAVTIPPPLATPR